MNSDGLAFIFAFFLIAMVAGFAYLNHQLKDAVLNSLIGY